MPHDKNGAELKAGDRVTIPCVVKSVSPGEYCCLEVETEEVMPGNGQKSTFSALNAKQVVKVGLVLLAVLLGSSLVGAAPPTPAQLQADNLADLKAVGERLSKVEARLAALEGKSKVGAASCGCDAGKPCTCGGACLCPPPGRKADAPKAGTVWLVKGYCGGVECWIPEGYQMDGWSRTPPVTSAVPWDCSSGVCRPVSGASYSGYSGGSCAGGSCGTSAASYGGGYGSFGAGAMFGGGSCSGGSCGSSGGGFGFFGRRR